MKRKEGLNRKKEKSGSRHPDMPENPVFLLEGAVLIGVIAYLFYDSPIAAIFLAPLLYPYYRRRSREKLQQDKKELSAQFREALAAIITALKAGYSAENAFIECRGEMRFQFGEKAMITREMKRISKGIENRIPLEKLLTEFAARWQIEEISEFAEVFLIARRSGGNLPEILGRTAEIIRGRMEINTEIDILLSSRKFEQKIMDGVPFFIIFYLGLSTEGFFSVLYHNVPGVLFMTGCLAAYLAAYMISDRIMAIEL
ncbi:MAG: type II secretion system F family protein [Lachnospiraceae bacterium]|nr:type II secretion system F family protein [Lachnospiraceae bacterium]